MYKYVNFLNDHVDHLIINLSLDDYKIIDINSVAASTLSGSKSQLVGQDIFKYCKQNKLKFNLDKDLFKNKCNEVFNDIRADIIDSKTNKTYHIAWTLGKFVNDASSEFMLIGKLLNEQNWQIDEKDKEIYILKNIINKLPGHLYWKDLNGYYLGSNEGNVISSGLTSAKELLGKTDYDMPWKKQADAMHAFDLEVINTGKSVQREEIGIVNGTKAHVLSQKSPLRDENGHIIGVIGNSVVITELKQLQEDLEKAKKAAEISNKMKTEFIANMEHDLRTPCSGILGMTKILENAETDSAKKEILHDIAQSAEVLLNLLNNVLEFSHIESGDIPVLANKFDFKRLIQSIAAIEKPIMQERNLRVMTYYDKKLPAILIGDEFRIFRIILNLVGNAVKFTQKGHIKVQARLAQQNEDTAIVQVTVEDTGIGIPKHKQKFIFDRFTKLESSNKSADPKGFGLGLAIVRQFIQELGGEIDVISTEGVGTKFICHLTFRLPKPEEIAAEKLAEFVTKPKDIPKLDLKILVVEDGKLALRVAKSILEQVTTIPIDIAICGEDAVKLCKKKEYDLIFTDIGLPGIDGYEVARRIRKMKQTQTPIVALTAHENEEVIKNIYAAGIDGFLTKPLDEIKTKNILDRYILGKEYSLDPKMMQQQIAQTASMQLNENSPAIDFIMAQEMLGFDKESLLPMVAMLVETFPETRTLIDAAMKIDDLEKLSQIAHKLKGGAVYCGTYRIRDTAKILELAANNKESKQVILDLTQRLYAEMDAVVQAYNALI